MNTQTQVLRLQAGQALAHPPRGGGLAVLTEGELLVQPPARWRGGSVVVPATVRLAAPAVLPRDPALSIVAACACTVTVQAEAPTGLGARLRRMLAGRRAPGGHRTPLAG